MENIYKRKVNKSLIPTCNIMGVNIAAINMEWLVSYLNENLEDIKGDYICVSNVHTNAVFKSSIQNKLFGRDLDELEQKLGVRLWENSAHSLWEANLYAEADNIQDGVDAALNLYRIVNDESAADDRIDAFLNRREDAYNSLKEAVHKESLSDVPQILTGSEVAFFDGISKAELIEDLTIQNTRVLLLEMDDTIHTAEDMEKYFGLVPLTVIPESDQVAQMETTHSSKKKRRKKNG